MDSLFSKNEAIKQMESGAKVTHRLFLEHEWITKKGNQIVFENGYSCYIDDFFHHRNADWWNHGWSIFSEAKTVNS